MFCQYPDGGCSLAQVVSTVRTISLLIKLTSILATKTQHASFRRETKQKYDTGSRPEVVRNMVQEKFEGEIGYTLNL